ncbi:MAG TPA: hypothetical protein VJ301_02725, partial [Propionibacteriaceae bacterium]|nr:hypothetical protein [Propionibacteriaceae bacterium]
SESLSEYCHRKARAMFYRLVHLPSASPIEVHSRALVGDPQLLMPSRLPTSGSTTNRRPTHLRLNDQQAAHPHPCLCDPGARPIPGSHGERPVVPRFHAAGIGSDAVHAGDGAPDFTDNTLTSEHGKSSFTRPPNPPTAIRAAMWLRLRSADAEVEGLPCVVVLCVAVVAATGAVLTAWRTPARPA